MRPAVYTVAAFAGLVILGTVWLMTEDALTAWRRARDERRTP